MRTNKITIWLILFLTGGLLNFATAQNTYIVNTNIDFDDGDPDTYTLRDAIIAANGSLGTDTIEFNIPGTGPHTIELTSSYPTITDPVIIDGYSQPGAAFATVTTPATLMIELDGTNMGGSYNSVFNVTAGNSTFQGLALNHFTYYGINLNTNGENTIKGNYIGLNPNGTQIVGGGTFGLEIGFGSSGNIVGGVTPADRNVISGNAWNNIDISYKTTSGNLIRGNYIGTNATGTDFIDINSVGISLNSAGDNNIIGGTDGVTPGGPCTGAANLISGNYSGISISNSANTTIQGNYIGTDVTGTIPLGQKSIGIKASNPSNTLIGGFTPQARNIISASRYHGVWISSSDPDPNCIIQGNYIGTDTTGTLDLGNLWYGINLAPASGITIGGTDPNQANLISGNDDHGILISANASTGNRITGNLIGTQADGISPMGNGGAGVCLGEGYTFPRDNTIGGTAPGTGNIIAFNGKDGVYAYDGTNSYNGIGNPILGNSIHNNGSPASTTDLGIDLDRYGMGDNGVTPNDPNDYDINANSYQNYPELISAVSSGSTLITGALNSTPNTDFRVEFFANISVDASGHGQGERFLGHYNVTTDPLGDISFSAIVPGYAASDEFISSTATDPNGNTSEFSACVPVGNITIDWYAIDTGGYMISSGGGFELSGTIGQPDAHPVVLGGDLELTGGFWYSPSVCFVDLRDLATFVSYWLDTGNNLLADFDNNGSVNLYDYNTFSSFWLRFCPDTWPWR
ncbi:MAG: hypothetical protein GY869_01785 [Planctomycetes bacterium]|nr:hypothetical protein [Planctomycetota bacterium]